MKVVIVDCGSGNLRSVANAFFRAVADAGAAVEVEISDQAEAVRSADRLVLPGQGAFGVCLAGLRRQPGLVAALEERVCRDGAPFLGICVGMQLLADVGRERGDHPGFGWLGGEVTRIPATPGRRIPHMGWNDLSSVKPHPLLAGVGVGDHVYFVHSYRYRPAGRQDILASAEYGEEVVAAVARRNIAGTQFHPEKSQKTGLRLIANFLRWQPAGEQS